MVVLGGRGTSVATFQASFFFFFHVFLCFCPLQNDDKDHRSEPSDQKKNPESSFVFGQNIRERAKVNFGVTISGFSFCMLNFFKEDAWLVRRLASLPTCALL